MEKNIKPIFDWAVANGEAKIVDRILIKLLPQFIKAGYKITENTIYESDTVEVSDELFNLVKDTAEEFVGSSYQA
jgi:hypothetical protein